MADKGILFAPDFAVNSGGVITLAAELAKSTLEEAREQTSKVFDTTLAILKRADEAEITTLQAALDVANERINA